MRRILLLLSCLIAMPAIAADVNAPATAPADDAAIMLQQIESIEAPDFDQSRRNDPQYMKNYRAKRLDGLRKKSELEKQFYTRFPDHPKSVSVMDDRWFQLLDDNKNDVVATETADFLAAHPNSPDRLEVIRARAVSAIVAMDADPAAPNILALRATAAQAGSLTEEFIKAAGKDDQRGAELLFMMSGADAESPAQKAEIYHRIIAQYPNSSMAKTVTGVLRQTAEIGKPFDLAFNDAISGKAISIQSLHGKIVVVDFWATWCGPCVGEIPHLKELYAQYKNKGVEFIGVSLDQSQEMGGLDKLKAFVKENQVDWPQDFQGNFWQSEFSSGWGIYSIPSVFIIDSQGKLFSTEARGKLDQLIPELIAKRDKPPAS